MPRDDLIEIEGVVLAAKGGGFYDVQPISGGAVIKVKVCGKMKQKRIQVLSGDKVTIGVSPYDLTLGIIIWRVK